MAWPRLNRSSNVELIPCVVGEDPGEAELYVVDRFNDACNSLRPPATPEPVRTVRVKVRRLDDILSELDNSKVDFLKLDAEGAELSVLHGAAKLLNRDSRPAMLVEVQDIRTKPWGYAAREILQFLVRMDYQWFAICRQRRAVADSVQPGNIRRKPGRASDGTHRRISKPAWAKVRGISKIRQAES